jgi:hypothetical protein
VPRRAGWVEACHIVLGVVGQNLADGDAPEMGADPAGAAADLAHFAMARVEQSD